MMASPESASREESRAASENSRESTTQTPAAEEKQEEIDDDVEDGEIESKSSPAENKANSASPPPLPDEPVPAQAQEDDGWAPVWDESSQAFYFFNRFTGLSQWENPRVPTATPAAVAPAPGTVDPSPTAAAAAAAAAAVPSEETTQQPIVAGGYNPAIHGDYDPTASYAQPQNPPSTADGASATAAAADPNAYAATGTFNRFTGRWQAASLNPENFNDENKSRRQMNAYFDVDAAANSHEGRSLKAERAGKKLTKKELKAFKEKRREKKEEKRRAWLRD